MTTASYTAMGGSGAVAYPGYRGRRRNGSMGWDIGAEPPLRVLAHRS